MDECRFSFDGTDNFCSWNTRTSNPADFRQMRAMKGGSVMVHFAICGDGLLSISLLKGNVNVEKYKVLLKNVVLPKISEKFPMDIYFHMIR